MTEVFRTARTIVRPWVMADLDDAFRIYGNAEFARVFNLPVVETIEDMATRLQSRIDRTDAMSPGYGMWAIQRQNDGDVVGLVALMNLPNDVRIEVGWHLWPGVWGQGYATEAGDGALRHGFEHHGLDEIFAIIRPENTASQGVATRLGMKRTGETLMHFEMLHEYWSISRQTYFARSSSSTNSNDSPS